MPGLIVVRLPTVGMLGTSTVGTPSCSCASLIFSITHCYKLTAAGGTKMSSRSELELESLRYVKCGCV